MKRCLKIVLLMAVVLGLRFAEAGEILDRIVVLVSGHPILLSDWDEEIRFSAMLDGKRFDEITLEEERDALQRLIDQELVRQQMPAGNSSLDNAQVEERMAEMRRQIPGAKGETGWRELLNRHGFTEVRMREKLALQIAILSFIDSRVMPGVRVENQSVADYYRDQLLPEARKAGEPAPPLESVAAQIRSILTQKRISELTREWLNELRSSSEIRVLDPGSSSAGANSPRSR